MNTRITVRCEVCSLNQFMTKNMLCRKCHAWIGPKAESPVVVKPSLIPKPIPRPATYRIDLACIFFRRYMGWSQYDLADKLVVPRTWVSKIENRKADPTMHSIDRLAAALGISPRQFMEFATITA